MRKTTLLVLVVLVVLAVAVFVVKRRPAERGIVRMQVAKVDAKAVDHITVGGPTPVELVKNGEAWSLADGREADKFAVQHACDAAGKLASSELIGRGSEQFAAYEVDDAKGASVSIGSGGKTLASFIVGKTLSNGNGAVRVGDEVFSVKGVTSSVFAKPMTAWLEHKVFAKTVADATRLEVRLVGEAPYVLAKVNDAWTVQGATPPDFKLDPSLAASLVGAVANLRDKDVLAKAEPANDGNEDVFAVAWKEGADTLHVSRSVTDGDVHAGVDGRDRTYVIADSTMTSLHKKLADLRDASLMQVDVAKVVGLTLLDGVNKTVFAKKDAVWTLVSSSVKTPDGFVLEPSAVDRHVTQIANAKGTRIVDAPPADTGLAAAKSKAILKLASGPEMTLVFGSTIKEGNKDLLYARGTTGRTVLAAPYLKNNVLSGITSFAKRAPQNEGDALSKIDPAQLQNLPPEVRAGLMKQIEQKRREQDLLKRVQTQK